MERCVSYNFTIFRVFMSGEQEYQFLHLIGHSKKNFFFVYHHSFSKNPMRHALFVVFFILWKFQNKHHLNWWNRFLQKAPYLKMSNCQLRLFALSLTIFTIFTWQQTPINNAPDFFRLRRIKKVVVRSLRRFQKLQKKVLLNLLHFIRLFSILSKHCNKIIWLHGT